MGIRDASWVSNLVLFGLRLAGAEFKAGGIGFFVTVGSQKVWVTAGKRLGGVGWNGGRCWLGASSFG